jgi:hypothetical protein
MLYLKHFLEHTKQSVEYPIHLPQANNEFHASTTAIDFCRENSVVRFGFLPHTSYHHQGLHVSFFGLLKRFATRTVTISWSLIHVYISRKDK